MLTCRTRRRPGVSALEAALVMCNDRALATTAALGSTTYVEYVCSWVAAVWPAIIVAVAAAMARTGSPLWIRFNWLPVLVFAVVPELLSLTLRWGAARRAAALRKEEGAIELSRKALLERVKAELPMQTALAVLMAHDPSGDHKAFIECPPHLMKQIDDLTQQLDAAAREKAEMLRALDEAVCALGSNVDGGWGAALELVRPIRDVLAKYQGDLRCSQFLFINGGVDAWILSKVMATPTRSSRKPSSSHASMSTAMSTSTTSKAAAASRSYFERSSSESEPETAARGVSRGNETPSANNTTRTKGSGDSQIDDAADAAAADVVRTVFASSITVTAAAATTTERETGVVGGVLHTAKRVTMATLRALLSPSVAPPVERGRGGAGREKNGVDDEKNAAASNVHRRIAARLPPSPRTDGAAPVVASVAAGSDVSQDKG